MDILNVGIGPNTAVVYLACAYILPECNAF